MRSKSLCKLKCFAWLHIIIHSSCMYVDKEKLHWILVKMARETLFETVAIGIKVIAIGERDWAQFHWKKGRRIFKWCGTLMEKYWRTVGERLVNMIRPSVFANWNLLKLGSYLPHRDWETDTLSFLKIVSKGKEAGRCSTSQRQKKNLQWQVF